MTLHPQSSQSPLSKERLRLWLKLLKASNAIEDDLRRKLRADYASTLPRFDVMSALSRAPDGLKMSDISKMLKVSNGNITGIVDKLSDEGLAQRVTKPGDRRAHLVCLTQKGKNVFSSHALAHEEWINDMLADLSADDISETTRRLDTLLAALRGSKDD